MKLQEFYSKPLDQRIILVSQQGTFLANCTRLSGTCSLFQLQDFFAEVWFKGQDGEIMFIWAFTDPAELQDYLDQISLSSIQHLVR